MPTATPKKSNPQKKPVKLPAKPSRATVKPQANRAAGAVARPVAKTPVKAAAKAHAKAAGQSVKVEKPGKTAISIKTSAHHAPAGKTVQKSVKPIKSAMPLKKASPVQAKMRPDTGPVAASAVALDVPVKKKPGRPPKNPAAAASVPAAVAAGGAKRGRKPKNAISPERDEDLSDVLAEFAESLRQKPPQRSSRYA